MSVVVVVCESERDLSRRSLRLLLLLPRVTATPPLPRPLLPPSLDSEAAEGEGLRSLLLLLRGGLLSRLLCCCCWAEEVLLFLR